MSLQELKQALPERFHERERLPASFWPGGVPRGALTALIGDSGQGKCSLGLSLLAQNPSLHAAWIEERFSLNPCAFPLAGVQLERVLFIEAGQNALWAAHQILESGLFEILLISSKNPYPEKELRKLQLASEKANASVLLLIEQLRSSRTWPISLRLKVNRHEQKPLCLPLHPCAHR